MADHQTSDLRADNHSHGHQQQHTHRRKLTNELRSEFIVKFRLNRTNSVQCIPMITNVRDSISSLKVWHLDSCEANDAYKLLPIHLAPESTSFALYGEEREEENQEKRKYILSWKFRKALQKGVGSSWIILDLCLLTFC